MSTLDSIYNLSFDKLRSANIDRLLSSKYAKCESDWQTAHWVQAMLGEFGELANILKKVDRGDFPISSVKQKIKDELGDIQTYLDILAYKLDINLGDATAYKFNIVSKRIGSNVLMKTVDAD